MTAIQKSARNKEKTLSDRPECLLLATPAAPAVAATVMAAAAMFFAMFPLLDLIFHQIAQDGTTDRAEKTMSSILAKIMSCHASTD